MKVRIKTWSKLRKSYSGLGISPNRQVTGHGYLCDEIEGNLDQALKNGMVFVLANGTHIFYAKNGTAAGSGWRNPGIF